MNRVTYGLRIFSVIVIAASLIMVPSTFSSFADKPSDKGKPDKPITVEELIAPKVVILKDGRIAEKVVHIFYEEGYSHKPTHTPGGKDKGGNGGDDDPKCNSFLFGGKTKWKSVEPYIVRNNNQDGLSDSFVKGLISGDIRKWEAAAGKDILGSEVSGTVDGPDFNSPDDKNEVMFGSITGDDSEGVIAFTIVWKTRIQNQLIEWDMFYNDFYKWGDAGPTNENGLGDTTIMDFDNITNHELGHATGMGHPDDSCTEETMYAFATFGETKKRTLHVGDIAGINDLY